MATERIKIRWQGLKKEMVVGAERYEAQSDTPFPEIVVDIIPGELLVTSPFGLLDCNGRIDRAVTSWGRVAHLAPTAFGECVLERYFEKKTIKPGGELFSVPETVTCLLFAYERYSNVGSVDVSSESTSSFHFGLWKREGVWNPYMFDDQAHASQETKIVYFQGED